MILRLIEICTIILCVFSLLTNTFGSAFFSIPVTIVIISVYFNPERKKEFVQHLLTMLTLSIVSVAFYFFIIFLILASAIFFILQKFVLFLATCLVLFSFILLVVFRKNFIL